MGLIEPSYYHMNGIDVIRYIELSQGQDAAIEFCRGNVLKYITRFDKKNGEVDLLKAQTYINRMLAIKYNKTTESTKVAGNFEPVVNGIREVNGVKLYRCSYQCECGDIGRRYVKEDAETTNCHKCNKEMKLYPATDNEAHDENFNYFRAY